MRRIPLTCGLVLTLGVAGALGNEAGPLVGKACPDFELAHSVQGPAWQKADLIGQVVVLDLFQLG